MAQFRVEEEMARLVRDNEAAEAEIETLRRQLGQAHEKLVRFWLFAFFDPPDPSLAIPC